MSIKSSHLAAIVVVGGSFVLGGCGAEVPGDEAGIEEAANITTQQQAVSSGWTSIAGQNLQPITCDGGSLPSAVSCTGSYCSFMRFYCQPTVAVPGSSYWTPYFSEEDSAKICDSGFMVTGLVCNGLNCDNLSLECTFLGGARPKNCQWTGWMSEENGGTLSFGTGFYLKGAQCDGSYCNNLRYYVCQL